MKTLVFLLALTLRVVAGPDATRAALEADWAAVLKAHPEAAFPESELRREMDRVTGQLQAARSPVLGSTKPFSTIAGMALKNLAAASEARIVAGTPGNNAEAMEIERRRAAAAARQPAPVAPREPDEAAELRKLQRSNEEMLREMRRLRRQQEEAAREAELRAMQERTRKALRR